MVYSFVVCKVMFFVQLAKQLQRNKIILSSFTLGGGKILIFSFAYCYGVGHYYYIIGPMRTIRISMYQVTDTTYDVHRLILAISSPVFEGIFYGPMRTT